MEREKKLVDTMRKHRVDGLIVSLSKNTVDYEHFEALKKYGIPVVFFDRVPNLADAYTVSCDLKDSSEKLVDWLVAQGHTKIGFIKGPESMTASQDRLQGYLHALEKNKLPQVPGYIVQTNLEKEQTQEAIHQLLSLPERPTAVIAFNDYITLDAIKFSRALGLKINKDIYFVSYANLPVTSYLDDRPLVSVEQFPYEQAEKATEMLLQLINQKADEIEEKRVVMSGEVVANEPSVKRD
jgi:LacI family transcriptional regulator